MERFNHPFRVKTGSKFSVTLFALTWKYSLVFAFSLTRKDLYSGNKFQSGSRTLNPQNNGVIQKKKAMDEQLGHSEK